MNGTFSLSQEDDSSSSINNKTARHNRTRDPKSTTTITSFRSVPFRSSLFLIINIGASFLLIS
jgi:hypothetical protein